MEAPILGFLDTINKYGHDPLELFLTDNPAADKDFFFSMFPSLVEYTFENRMSSNTNVL